MTAPWTEAHRREAHRALYRAAAEMSPSEAEWMTGDPRASFSEKRFRIALASVGKPAPARIDREVRRVRALAEGRMVRETAERWEVLWSSGGREFFDGDRDRAHHRAREFADATVVHITAKSARIRKASR